MSSSPATGSAATRASPALLLVAVSAVFTMSIVPVLVKSTSANEATIGIARLCIAVLAFTPVVFWRGKLLKLSLAQWRQLFVIGLVFALHWWSYFASIKLATASVAALVITTYGVQYLVLAYIFNGERVRPVEWMAIACCFAGCVIAAPELGLRDATTRGVAIGLFSALLYAALPLLHQRAASIGTLERTWGQFFFALLCFLPLWSYTHWQLGLVDVYLLLILGLLCTVVSHGLWVKASTELPAIYTSMIYYLYLPLTVVSSAIFLGERFTVVQALGAALVLAASLYLSWQRSRAQD